MLPKAEYENNELHVERTTSFVLHAFLEWQDTNSPRVF